MCRRAEKLQLRLTSLAPLALVARNCIPMALNGPSNDPPLAIHVARGSPCSGPSEALHRGGPQWPPNAPPCTIQRQSVILSCASRLQSRALHWGPARASEWPLMRPSEGTSKGFADALQRHSIFTHPQNPSQPSKIQQTPSNCINIRNSPEN